MKGVAGLVGRSGELGALRAALDRAMAGQPAFVLLLGEPGIGKTRLLAAVAEEATARGLRPLIGTSIESGMALPYLPLMAALPGAFAGPPTREATTETTTNSDPADAASAARMVEAIHDAVVREPSVLMVDDIQWADASTLTVLDYLAHRARDSRLAVIVAARDEPAALARLSIADGRRYTPIRLARLGRGDVAGQIQELSGATPAPTVVERIYGRTDGNPFFVEQLVAAQSGSSEAGPLPASLRLLVERRVGRLGEPTRRVLAALAIIGRPADPAELSAVAAASRAIVDEALAEAVAQGVVVIEPGGITLRHPLFTEVIADGIERTERAVLHGRAATVMETLDRPVAEIAEHWWQADDPGKAWGSALVAGDAAERSRRSRRRGCISNAPCSPGLRRPRVETTSRCEPPGRRGSAATLSRRLPSSRRSPRMPAERSKPSSRRAPMPGMPATGRRAPEYSSGCMTSRPIRRRHRSGARRYGGSVAPGSPTAGPRRPPISPQRRPRSQRRPATSRANPRRGRCTA